MTKEEFKNLDIDSKVNYINSRLSEGNTVIRIREDLGIGEKYLQKELKGKYKFNPKNRRYDKEPTSGITDKKPTNSIHEVIETTNNIHEAKEPTISLPNNIKNDLLEMLTMKDDLKEVIKAFKEGYAKEPTNVIEIIDDKGIKISLPDDEVVRTTVRANKSVLNSWNEFCNNYKEFSKQDLISMAMIEYIEKYK